METPARPPQQMHFLFVTSPLQGHINPVRRLAARVMAANPDALVTFSTAVSGHCRMFPSLARPDDEAVDAAGVLHVPFSDGFDDGFSSAAACLPGLPPLEAGALPSAVSITSPEHRHYLLLDLLRDLFLSLDEHKPRVLVNTFDALEPDALRAVPQLEVAAVGPVVPDDASSPSSACW